MSITDLATRIPRHSRRAFPTAIVRLRPTVAATLAARAQLTGPSIAHGAVDGLLPQVTVRAEERADGPVQGYRATRSATFTKTDTPFKDDPASVTVVPEQLMQD